uniref:Integrase zinc-binding domain-containing protein n=1 Tax=Populus alba TaxID=43335 RepID=A0A4U5N9U2_POPAL|nr:hypothetical protein D5086_0000269270 [Populus alba]
MNLQSEDTQGADTAGGGLAAITQVVPTWYDQVYSSYQGDAKLQDILQGTLINTTQASNFTYNHGVIRYKGRMVIGAAGTLREELVKTTHDSYIGGHAGIQNTYRRLKALPIVDEEGRVKVYPVTILERKLMKKGNIAVVAGLIQWSNSFPEDATWEELTELQLQFPDFNISM